MKCIIALLLCITSSYSLNILGIFPYQGKSHFFVFRVLLRELAEQGHNVTVITYFPENKPPKNYNEVILSEDEVVEESMAVSRSYSDILKLGLFLTGTGITNCIKLLSDDRVKNLVNQKYDVILMEKFNSDCAHGLAYKIGAPVVGLTSHVLMPYHYSALGIPYNPAYVPFHFLEGGTKPTLFQRLERTVLDFYFKSLFSYTTFQNQKTINEHLGGGIPHLSELASQTKFLLLYHNFVLTGSRSFPSNVIEVGGYHVQPPTPLPEDLDLFMNDAASREHGVIYISFGTLVKPSSLSPLQKKAILDTLATLPQKFIWKWDDDSLNVDKDKVFIAKWLPQNSILSHPNTVAFLSHAGMLGTTEAVHSGVPIVAMPVLGDQPSNAAAIEESGAGVQLSVNNLTKENLVGSFRKVLKTEFRERVKMISKAWRDRPLPPLKEAIFWIEYAAQYSDLNFTSPAAFVPFYQEMNLDITAVFTAILLIIIIAIQKILWSQKGNLPNKMSKKKRKTK